MTSTSSSESSTDSTIVVNHFPKKQTSKQPTVSLTQIAYDSLLMLPRLVILKISREFQYDLLSQSESQYMKALSLANTEQAKVQ
jgi:hypothetical protein